MTEQEARRHAEEQREAHGVPAGWRVTAAERRWINLPAGKAEQPSPARDLLAGVVHFAEQFSWVELAVDDATGQVVRVEQSR